MTKPQIIKRIEFWKKVLGIENWNTTIHFKKPRKSKYEDANFQTYASINTHLVYKTATIKINPDTIRYFEDQDIIHELVHIILAPLVLTAKENSKDIETIDYYHEQVTSELTHIFKRFIDLIK